MEAMAAGGICAASYVASSTTSSAAAVKLAGEKKSGISLNSRPPRGCFVCHRRSSSLPVVRLPASGSRSGLTLSRPRRSNATWQTLTLPTWRSKRLDVRSMATTEEVEAEKELVETDTMERMDKALDSLRGNFNSVRTGRASPALLDRIEIEYYGSLCSLKTIAQINTPDGSTLMITPFDKASLQSIERALLQSDLGLTPSNDGTVIRLNIPQLTQDRRKELLKTVAKLAEEAKDIMTV
ncbi:hypothetical protein CBR_g26330 [Chara braunii]|uniref:Ribosome-recycling factor, chloroplastic n=1 Tax=Chara braunii TaxID=69332 RepID=A0A388L7L4_CHABU|nr:hypothetical protein CBR_g26330 [Chara braunii]|eukprot:GBG78300.1 hypothetical protein CBR_g26330 [Chara braunii]